MLHSMTEGEPLLREFCTKRKTGMKHVLQYTVYISRHVYIIKAVLIIMKMHMWNKAWSLRWDSKIWYSVSHHMNLHCTNATSGKYRPKFCSHSSPYELKILHWNIWPLNKTWKHFHIDSNVLSGKTLTCTLLFWNPPKEKFYLWKWGQKVWK